MRNATLSGIALLALLPGALTAQADSTRTAAAGPPVLAITSAAAVAKEPLGMVASVWEMADGRILVNDGQRRRLLLMDTLLTDVRVVLDSLSDVANTYGTRAGAILPFRADTVLFMDPAAYAMVVLDPQAKPTRVRSVWRADDVYLVSSSYYGIPGVDPRGRVIYRMPARPALPTVIPPTGVPYIPPEPDSAFIVAVDLDTRKLDTLATIRTPVNELRVRRTTEGSFTIDQVVNPLPLTDEWAVLPDGTVAIVRGRDYRVEYLSPDGQWTSSPKLPYDWQRLADEDKAKVADSTRTAIQRRNSMQFVSDIIRWVNLFGRDYPPNFTVPEGVVPNPGIARDWILPRGLKLPDNYMYACPPGVTPSPAMMSAALAQVSGAAVSVTAGASPAGAAPAGAQSVRIAGAPAGGAPGAAGAPGAPGAANPAGANAPGTPPCVPAPTYMTGGAIPPVPQPRQALVLSAQDLPDYRPPFAQGSVRADRDGNLWIRTNPTKPLPGGPVYDVVNRSGELVARYQLPPNYQLVGFGRDKVVFVLMRDPTGMKLARVRLK